MKNLRLFIASLVVFTLIFTSCSKDEPQIEGSEKASLSFGAIVNDLLNRSGTKQAVMDLPACSDDTPAYVHVVLMQGDTEIVGTETEPYRVDLVAGQIFTEEDPALQLDPGSYSLNHFSVYNDAGDLLWIAPRLGSELAEFVDGALPLTINLGAGVKKYVEVPVLCFDDREVNQYGYLFFELDEVRAYELCFFANYCDDDGRHYTANYNLDIWLGTDNTGEILYSDLVPETGIDENGDFFARPVCVALPINDVPDEDYIYYEATLLNWNENYDSPTPIVLSGTLSRNDIEANFGPDMTVEYEHLRFNCVPGGGEPTGPVCLPAITGDCERAVFIQMVGNDGPSGLTEFYPIFTQDGDEVGTIRYNLVKRPAMKDLLTATVDLNDGWTATHARFTLPNVDEDDVCVNNINDDNFDMVYEAANLTYPVQARVAINVCPE
ncbi:hypothetical protein SAMN04488034_10393 [Salinimicrobium catena]|uniref:Uncharacterized protein n=2 Tax=Salinimicrobium catena TaxID=390640 RepID=A0A1H5MVZ4_9FLAO|nr:hypothetical protein SAMN04488140_10393 [Salinimicrobium catena]SEE92528.1 hypothetical protein SAMN04488034_10393 [Salinimicrobium catena]